MKLPYTYWPVAAVKLNVLNSHGRLVPVVERTVKALLNICCGCANDVETLVPTSIVLVVTCSKWVAEEAWFPLIIVTNAMRQRSAIRNVSLCCKRYQRKHSGFITIKWLPSSLVKHNTRAWEGALRYCAHERKEFFRVNVTLQCHESD